LLDGDYGWQGFYYVRDFIKGINLKDYIKKQKIGQNDAINIIANAASILAFTHKNGIIHGALKPGNIFLNEKSAVTLTDFIIEGEIKESMPQKALFILEESEYASPEEIYGTPAQAASDTYALGVILYELLAGSVPFRDNPNAKITGSLPSMSFAPKYLEDILTKALSKDPLLRFATIEEFGESLKCRTIIGIKEKWELPSVELENAPRAEEKAVIPIKKERKRSFFLLIVLLISVLAGIIYSIINSFLLGN
jgi:serine/threonine protein kinase